MYRVLMKLPYKKEIYLNLFARIKKVFFVLPIDWSWCPTPKSPTSMLSHHDQAFIIWNMEWGGVKYPSSILCKAIRLWDAWKFVTQVYVRIHIHTNVIYIYNYLSISLSLTHTHTHTRTHTHTHTHNIGYMNSNLSEQFINLLERIFSFFERFTYSSKRIFICSNDRQSYSFDRFPNSFERRNYFVLIHRRRTS